MIALRIPGSISIISNPSLSFAIWCAPEALSSCQAARYACANSFSGLTGGKSFMALVFAGKAKAGGLARVVVWHVIDLLPCPVVRI